MRMRDSWPYRLALLHLAWLHVHFFSDIGHQSIGWIGQSPTLLQRKEHGKHDLQNTNGWSVRRLRG